MSRSERPVFILIVAVAGSAAAVLAVDGHPRMQHAPQFHHLVGGLGFGPALNLDRCGFSFDPRLSPNCSCDDAPTPGGRAFCPHHPGAVLDYSPLPLPGSPSERDRR